jgi:glycosyl transferase family 25
VSPFAGFDRIRIINLPSRPDRRAEMLRELHRLGIAEDPRVRFVDGVLVEDKARFRRPGENGVFRAHLNILSDAANAGESVLILEDDVDFTEAALSWHRPHDCDIAYGGYEASDPADLEASDIIGAHCMGFSAGAAQALVPFLESLLEHESPPPIDGAYVWFRRQHENITTEFAIPVVAVQRPSRSDIAKPRWFDNHPLLRLPVESARRLKRRLARGGPSFGLKEALIVAVAGIAIATFAAYYNSR